MRADDQPQAFEGVVIGRMCNERISIRCDGGPTISFRAAPELGAQLDVGQRAVVELDPSGGSLAPRGRFALILSRTEQI